MPQDSHHPQYDHYFPQWQRCRDACSGEDAIKGAALSDLSALLGGSGSRYLPCPSGMDAADYQAYKTRAMWYGATARVRQGYKGLVFREPPVIVAPEIVLTHAVDITRTGISLESLCEYTVEEHLTTGHIGLLVDLPGIEQPANAVRPQWTLYRAEQIINWRPLVLPTGETRYSQIMLEEAVDEPDPADSYIHRLGTQWRELVLVEGVYVVRVWRKATGAQGTRFMLVEERVPTRRGQPLDFIPFVTEPVLDNPPLLDVVDVNLSHYRTSADYKHELHMTSLATAYITGHDSTETQYKIGSLAAWVLPEPGARVGFLEVSGHGLQAKLDDLKSCEAQMAVLGARLLEPQRRSVESGETHQIRQSAELSIMEAYAESASFILATALRWHAWWAGTTELPADDTVLVTLNTDFLATTLDAPTLTAYVAAWQAGAITQADLYYNLSQGDVLEPGVTFEQWRSKLTAEAPDPLMGMPVRGEVPSRNGIGESVA
jgi:hypothetical protein